MYERNGGNDETVVEFIDRMKIQLDLLVSEGVVEWIDTGAEVIDVSATCGPDCAVAVADYRDAI